MITIEIPQGLGQKPGIYFRPASVEFTERGKLVKTHFDALVAALEAPETPADPAPAAEPSDAPPAAPGGPASDPTTAIVQSAPAAGVVLGDRTPVTDPVNDIFATGPVGTVGPVGVQGENGDKELPEKVEEKVETKEDTSEKVETKEDTSAQ